ncbi:MAG: hypothetical protein IKN62_02810 [Elusimicrobia bacterium]|nr:hypothetical protein [Elusimicrobiota bacterium]
MFKKLFISKTKLSIFISILILISISAIIFYKAVNYKTVMVEDLLFSSQYYEQFQNEGIVKKIFTTSVYFDKIKYLYRPVFILSFYVDSKISLGKVNVKINHITSLLLHLLCVLIFFCFLVNHCNFKIYLALLGALFFSINIFSVWSAVWLCGRCDLLLFLFAFSSFIFFIKANETDNNSRKIFFLLIHFILFFAAVLSKETAVVLPFVCLIFAYIKGYKIKFSYLFYVIIYFAYFLMYSNDVNFIKQFMGLFNKDTLYMICDYLSAPFYLSKPKIVPAYNFLTILKGLSVMIFFFVVIMKSKEKKLMLFYILFAILFFLPTLLAKRIAFQGNRMYFPMACIIISLLYMIDEFCKNDLKKIKTKVCTMFLIIFIIINSICVNNAMKFAYDDDSAINTISNEYMEDFKNRDKILKVAFFLADYYSIYGYSKQANIIRNKFFILKSAYKTNSKEHKK